MFRRLPMLPGESSINFLKILRPGKFRKSKLKVLKSPGKISAKVIHFSSG